MYNMISQESKNLISKEDFISRNKNIYEGLDASNINIEIMNIEKEKGNIKNISYNFNMNTEAGEIKFFPDSLPFLD